MDHGLADRHGGLLIVEAALPGLVFWAQTLVLTAILVPVISLCVAPTAARIAAALERLT